MRMTRRAARRRRWKLAIVALAVAGGFVAWWLRTGGELPPLDLQAGTSPAPVGSYAPSMDTLGSAPIAPAPVASVPQPHAAETTQAQIAELDAAHARDTAWANARRESIRVQQRLREEAAEQRARANALETDDEMRCIEGRRMRRVSNGWVDAGTC